MFMQFMHQRETSWADWGEETHGNLHGTMFGGSLSFPSKGCGTEGGRKSLTVEKPDKHSLSQVIKANIHGDKSCS